MHPREQRGDPGGDHSKDTEKKLEALVTFHPGAWGRLGTEAYTKTQLHMGEPMGLGTADVARFLPSLAVRPPTVLHLSGMSWVVTEHLLWNRSCTGDRRMNESPPCPPGAQSAEGQAAGMHCLVGGEPAVRTRSWTGAGWQGAGSGRSQAERYLSQTGAQGSLAQEQTLELGLLDKKGDWGKAKGKTASGKSGPGDVGSKGSLPLCGPGVHGAVGADVYGAQGSCAVGSAFVVCSRRGQTGVEKAQGREGMA